MWFIFALGSAIFAALTSILAKVGLILSGLATGASWLCYYNKRLLAGSLFIAKKDLLPGRERRTSKVLSNKSYLNDIINLQSQRSRY